MRLQVVGEFLKNISVLCVFYLVTVCIIDLIMLWNSCYNYVYGFLLLEMHVLFICRA
jgi:hypothetical protein